LNKKIEEKMSGPQQVKCPLCTCTKCTEYPNLPARSTYYKCANCGEFNITGEAISAGGNNLWKLCPYVTDQNLRGITPIFYSAQSVIRADSPSHSVGVDAVIEAFPKSVAARLDHALINAANATEGLGQGIAIGSGMVSPLLLSQNDREAYFIMQQLAQEGFIQGNFSTLPSQFSVTAKGFNRAADLQRGLFGPHHKQVFVAMSFDKSLNEAWSDGLKVGIEDAVLRHCVLTKNRITIKYVT
jgi:hypothetical protein